MDTTIKSIGGGVIGTIVPQNSRWGLTNGYKIIEVSYEEHQTREFPTTESEVERTIKRRCL